MMIKHELLAYETSLKDKEVQRINQIFLHENNE